MAQLKVTQIRSTIGQKSNHTGSFLAVEGSEITDQNYPTEGILDGLTQVAI